MLSAQGLDACHSGEEVEGREKEKVATRAPIHLVRSAKTPERMMRTDIMRVEKYIIEIRQIVLCVACVRTCVHVCLHLCVHVYAHACVCKCVHACVHVQVCAKSVSFLPVKREKTHGICLCLTLSTEWLSSTTYFLEIAIVSFFFLCGIKVYNTNQIIR